jgi:hypothetical protein
MKITARLAITVMSLTEGKDETWIPRSVILLIKTYSQEPP